MELSLQKKINLRLIRLLRKSMIEEAGLHIEDKVTYGVKNMRVAGSNCAVLTDIEVPEEYLAFLSEKVVRKEHLTSKQEITREEFYNIFNKYSGVISERQFAIDILGMSEDSLSNFLLGKYKKSAVFYKEEVTDIEELRKKIIKENFLHYDDPINYTRFLDLRARYAPTMKESLFAEKVLDIPSTRFPNIKGDNKRVTPILLGEELPSEEDIAILKRKILIGNGIHIKDRLKYSQIQEYHRKYGGIMPEYMFADKIFDIGKTKLNSMSRNPEEEAVILTRTKIPIRQLSKLRNKVLGENKVVQGTPITLENFEKWFTGYKHILSRIMFARGVIGVSKANYGNLRDKKTSAIKALMDDAPEKLPWVSTEKIPRKKKQEVLKKEKKLPKKKKTLKPPKPKKGTSESDAKKAAKSILKNYVYTPKNVARVTEYIHSCKAEYECGAFEVTDLPLLYDCIEFAQGGLLEISIYTQIAISFRKYNEARRCIFANMDNEGISADDKSKFREMIKGLDRAISREKAVNLLSSKPDADVRQIMYDTGLSEIEIIEIRKKLLSGEENPSIREKLFGED